jgi:hypothetical protein
MRPGLTAVFVPQPEGWIASPIACHGVNSPERVMGEAHEILADALQMIGESYRDERLAGAGTEALVLELSGLR